MPNTYAHAIFTLPSLFTGGTSGDSLISDSSEVTFNAPTLQRLPSVADSVYQGGCLEERYDVKFFS